MGRTGDDSQWRTSLRNHASNANTRTVSPVCPSSASTRRELARLHPDECIDCGACEPEVPPRPIFDGARSPRSGSLRGRQLGLLRAKAPSDAETDGWPQHLIDFVQGGDFKTWPGITATRKPCRTPTKSQGRGRSSRTSARAARRSGARAKKRSSRDQPGCSSPLLLRHYSSSGSTLRPRRTLLRLFLTAGFARATGRAPRRSLRVTSRSPLSRTAGAAPRPRSA